MSTINIPAFLSLAGSVDSMCFGYIFSIVDYIKGYVENTVYFVVYLLYFWIHNMSSSKWTITWKSTLLCYRDRVICHLQHTARRTDRYLAGRLDYSITKNTVGWSLQLCEVWLLDITANWHEFLLWTTSQCALEHEFANSIVTLILLYRKPLVLIIPILRLSVDCGAG